MEDLISGLQFPNEGKQVDSEVEEPEIDKYKTTFIVNVFGARDFIYIRFRTPIIELRLTRKQTKELARRLRKECR